MTQQISRGNRIVLPPKYNYIGVFLTLRCRMGCNYCINRQGNLRTRRELKVEEWVKILRPIQTREDLPITLQGGEPTEYKGFYELVRELHRMGKRLDILTNGSFDVKEFIYRTDPMMFRRRAPYASIRFSYHKKTNAVQLLTKVLMLQDEGYSVGIWGLRHPDMLMGNAIMQHACKSAGVDFRLKEYIDKRHGTYKYPDAVMGLKDVMVHCQPSELLFAPDGKNFPCHHWLYSNDYYGIVAKGQSGVIDIVSCNQYGNCNPCDVKLKTNRLQKGGHCSVEITKC